MRDGEPSPFSYHDADAATTASASGGATSECATRPFQSFATDCSHERSRLVANWYITPSTSFTAPNRLLTPATGSFSELLRVPDEAMHAYERALQANPNSTPAMNAIGMLLKGREAFDKALEFFRAIVQLDQNNGEAWGNLGK